MHCRFVKRFIICVIFLCFGCLWLVSRFVEKNGERTAFKFLAESEKLFNPRRRHLDEEALNQILKSTIGDIDKSNLTFTKADWMVDVLDKNLSKYDAIERILTEIDKHIPDEYSESELTIRSLPVQSPSMRHSLETLSKAAEIPTEPVTPNFHAHRRNITKRRPPDTLVPGFMNVHIWEAWCGRTVEDLRHNKHFPLYPDFRTITNDLFVKQRATDYGQRIFGYLHPPKTGYFTFCLSSDDNSELWLSNSSNPNFVRILAWVGNLTNPGNTELAEFQRFRGQISAPVYLVEGEKYFMEVLHKQASFMEHVLVAWKGPGIHKTKMITENYISAYVDVDELDQDVNSLAEYIPETSASFPTHVHGSYDMIRNASNVRTSDRREHLHLSPMINESDVAELLPKCEYKPSYVVDFQVNRYEGVTLIHDTAVFPNDQTELVDMTNSAGCDNRNADSHLNLLRPTEAPELPEGEGDDGEGGDSDVAVTMSPKLSSQILKYRKRFQAFWDYLKTNKDASNKRKIVYGKYLEGIRNGKIEVARSKHKEDRVGAEKRLSGKRKSALSAGRKTQNSSKNKIFAQKSEKDSKHAVFSLRKTRLKRLNIRDKKMKNRKRIIYSNKNLRNKQQANKVERVHIREKLAKRKSLAKKRNKKVPVEHELAGKPRKGYETERTGRKLLVVGWKNLRKYVYEEDDEGLEIMNNKISAKPIFIPIEGVENMKKPLPKRKFIPLKALKTPAVMSSSDYEENNDSENGDDNSEANGSDNAEANFQMKNAYKRFNITSNRDIMKYFKMYRYAFYDMIADVPRIHAWKYKFSLSQCRSDGNLLLNEKVASNVVNKYMKQLKIKHKDKYTLKRVVNVEENHDVMNGDRYLVELDLKVKGHGEKLFRLSRYVYQKLGSLELCEPVGFQWNTHADVHVIVPVKNQGRWVQHFIDNMERIYLETMDPHLNVIIVDFNSTDIDIEASLRRSKLKRYRLIRMDGMFERALGIQAGADVVKNANDIIFTCDLHLEIPTSLIDSIRKHCVLGKMAFAPIVLRLDCGYRPENPSGLWEIQGYGLFAICKSDFDKAGGMNTKEFKTKWGGEDWEMLDRILSNGIEVERLRIPNFYHHFHSKKRMWNKA